MLRDGFTSTLTKLRNVAEKVVETFVQRSVKYILECF